MDALNALPADSLTSALMACCGSRRWARAVAARAPYSSTSALQAAAKLEWWRLNKEDWKEAFAAHPRIGDISVLKAKFNQQKGHGGFEGEEQAGARGASEAVLRELHALNEAYDAKFGFVFLICATGKSAEEMLRSLRERVGYGIEDELLNAAQEHEKITEIRITKLLQSLEQPKARL